MKLFKNLAFAAVAISVLSCEKDFLETFPTAELSQEQVAEAVAINPGAAEGTLLGIYEQFYRIGSGGVGGQEDFGIKTQDIFTDMLSGDMAHTGKSYSRMVRISELTATIDPKDNYNYVPWRYLYRVVNLSNLVIDGLGGDTATLDTDVARHTMGQAKAARGFAYYNLVHLFTDDISQLSKPVLPIYTSADQPEQPKSTVQAVFDQALADLLAAETLLADFSRTAKIEFNQDIVRGLLAYTYGAMNNWPKTAEYAEMVVNAGYPIMTANEVAVMGDGDTVGGFNDVNSHPGIMWGIDITSSNELYSLGTWWGHMDYYSYAYAAVGNRKSIDVSLYNEMADDDIRKKQFPFYPQYGGSYLIPVGKFYYKGAQEGGFNGFSGPQLNIDSDSHYMRIAEMYLLHAEASAENGQDAAARTSLKALLDLRVGDTTYLDALSGQALKDEISVQTRLELFGEGKSYFLMKRQRQSRTRGANWLDLVGETFSHSDDRLTYEIPQNELLFNTNYSEQN
ncbi:RagB/SusD family nutrient uptake outer membrane protein [Flavobacteriaceae bacterium]|nr:RagB/SusD family nutrient uptake outer membrane protein [Flavobacteriaceae bacterium]MDB9886026.1 RagB/SusD family nutrient uptake outer membrane protein [Flavobacteriaceae bacterium]